MRFVIFFCVLALVLTVQIKSAAAAKAKRRWIRVVIRYLEAADRVLDGRRSIEEVDANKNSIIDQDELETILRKRDAEIFQDLADVDGDSEISYEEFAKSLETLATSDIE